ncbi:MAG TPA: DNA N-6-adenine-methyltransferase [Nitrososphaera sp.]
MPTDLQTIQYREQQQEHSFPRALLTTIKQDWQTPPDLFGKLKGPFEILLDPCTSDDNPLGTKYFITEAQDGLKQDWLYNAFVNPPYRYQRPFIEQALAQAYKQNTINLCLIPSRTDTQLYQDLIWPRARAICFVRKRIPFIDSSVASEWLWLFGEKRNSSTFPSLIVAFAKRSLSKIQQTTLEDLGATLIR